MSALAIGPDTVVTLSYELFGENGEVVDRAEPGDPLVYVHGYAQIVPGLEKALVGAHAGERRSVLVEPEEGFGEREEEAIYEVDRADFPDSASVQVGDEFVGEGPGGLELAMRVVEIRDDGFVVDTNHPLAGQKVRFEVEVKDVRPASEEEISRAEAELEEELEGIAAAMEGEGEHEHGEGCGHDHEGGDGQPEGGSLVQISKRKT